MVRQSAVPGQRHWVKLNGFAGSFSSGGLLFMGMGWTPATLLTKPITPANFSLKNLQSSRGGRRWLVPAPTACAVGRVWSRQHSLFVWSPLQVGGVTKQIKSSDGNHTVLTEHFQALPLLVPRIVQLPPPPVRLPPPADPYSGHCGFPPYRPWLPTCWLLISNPLVRLALFSPSTIAGFPSSSTSTAL